MPVFQISGTTIATLLNTAKKRNLTLFAILANSETITIPDKDKETITKIYSMISHHLELIAKESAGQILYSFLKETGLLQKMIDAQSAIDEKEAQNIARFFEKLKSFETEKEENSLFAVVDWID